MNVKKNMVGDIFNASDNIDDEENFGFTESYFKIFLIINIIISIQYFTSYIILFTFIEKNLLGHALILSAFETSESNIYQEFLDT